MSDVIPTFLEVSKWCFGFSIYAMFVTFYFAVIDMWKKQEHTSGRMFLFFLVFGVIGITVILAIPITTVISLGW